MISPYCWLIGYPYRTDRLGYLGIHGPHDDSRCQSIATTGFHIRRIRRVSQLLIVIQPDQSEPKSSTSLWIDTRLQRLRGRRMARSLRFLGWPLPGRGYCCSDVQVHTTYCQNTDTVRILSTILDCCLQTTINASYSRSDSNKFTLRHQSSDRMAP